MKLNHCEQCFSGQQTRVLKLPLGETWTRLSFCLCSSENIQSSDVFWLGYRRSLTIISPPSTPVITKLPEGTNWYSLARSGGLVFRRWKRGISSAINHAPNTATRARNAEFILPWEKNCPTARNSTDVMFTIIEHYEVGLNWILRIEFAGNAQEQWDIKKIVCIRVHGAK